MKQFVVNFETSDGMSEIFGIFASEKEAIAWMNTDANDALASLDDSYYIENQGDTRIEIEDYGYWMVQEITIVK